ncbi:MAG: helix-turn-helix transcriptional regulator [Methyloceanibacter sp.]
MSALTRTADLTTKFAKKGYRDSYVARHIKSFLASQIRLLRGANSQAAFGRLLGKPQSVVSRLEDPDYGQVTLQTLLDIASKLDVALIVRFVSFPIFVRFTNDLSPAALAPQSYDLTASVAQPPAVEDAGEDEMVISTATPLLAEQIYAVNDNVSEQSFFTGRTHRGNGYHASIS